MRLVAIPLHDHAAELASTHAATTWIADAGLAEDPTLQAAASNAWDVRCPYAFEVRWNGGPDPTDIWISAPGFAVSHVGHGVVTLRSGHEVHCEGARALSIRGPFNQHKEGGHALEQLVEADLLPMVLDVHWRITRPNQVVRFQRGESIATIRPVDPTAEPSTGASLSIADGPLPGISCVCPAYGRPALLAEAIESFLRQDYGGPTELVIVNDLASQTLVFEHPRVVIHNLPYRFSSLGEKLNAGVGLARYDLIAPWLDDDIYLPHRLQYSIDRLDPRTGFFKARSAFFWNNGRLQSIERNAFHGGSLWTRDLFVAARGYPHHTDGVDQAIERAFARAKLDSGVGTAIPPRDNYYIYRWSGTGSYHTSVIEPTDDSPRGRYTAVERAVADALNRGDLPTGIVQLDPAWSSDYVAECTAFLTTAASAQSQPVRSAGEADEALPVVFGTRPKRRSARRSLALFDDSREARISVVLPALNEAHLERTLRQFARTLPPNSEVVVVDNGTTDTSVDFLAKHADIQPAADPALTTLDVDTPGVAVRLLRYDRPLGVSAARNRGMEHARGEVVVFSDAHVDVPDGWWAPIVETLQRREVGIVGPAIGVMGRDNAPLACGQRIADADLRVEWLPWMGPRPRPVPTLGGGFVAMRRETLEAAGAFDDGMQQWGSEDLEICLRYWMLGFEAWVVPEVEIPHYFRKASPYHVEWKHVLVNLMRTAYLHLNEERVARFLHATANNSQYTRALAACANSDVWIRRDQLRRQRKHDDDWYFHHPAFQDISMELRDA